MQTLDIISVNIGQIVISLCNLLLLFLILKKFLYKPVKSAIEKREANIREQTEAAERARIQAEEKNAEWDKKMLSAQVEASRIVKTAADEAKVRRDKLVQQAEAEAESIVNRARTDAELEHRKAEAEIKNEIVVLSSALTEKILSREINANDHKALIDEFIDDIGDLK